MPFIFLKTAFTTFRWIFCALATVSFSAVAQQELDCLIEPHTQVALSSPVEGILETTTVERGDYVEKDQILGYLRADMERLNVALARTRLEMEDDIKAKEATWDFGKLKQARHDKLFKKNIISSQERDEVKTEARLAELELQKAKNDKRLQALELEQAIENLKLRTLRSPIRGVVVERLVSPGESVKDKSVFQLAQIDPLNVEVIAPVALFGTIKSGMRAEVMPEEPVGGVHLADVKIIDHVIDAASGTFGIRLELPNPNYQLPAGLSCQVRFLPMVASGL
jgi:RND family efflux transporter MFP subunit